MDPLVFIDTNIILDFYRMKRGDVRMSMLEKVLQNIEHIICSDQVEMEYKKNRQKVIAQHLNENKGNNSGLAIPEIISQSQSAKAYLKKRKEIQSYEKKITDKIEKILVNPTYNDDVFKCVQKLFKSNHDLNLSREHKNRHIIRKKAFKRFILGHPPRKGGDTSIGDAVNWEWMIECCIESGKDLVIVSRDGDYGISYKNQTILNDWLSQEFKERVSRKRKVILTPQLTEAFNLLDVAVSNEERAEESRLLSSDEFRPHIKNVEYFDGGSVEEARYKFVNAIREILESKE